MNSKDIVFMSMDNFVPKYIALISYWFLSSTLDEYNFAWELFRSSIAL